MLQVLESASGVVRWYDDRKAYADWLPGTNRFVLSKPVPLCAQYQWFTGECLGSNTGDLLDMGPERIDD
jgi:hypothetical protein